MFAKINDILKYITNICETKIQEESLEEPLLKYCENDNTNDFLIQKSYEYERLNHMYPIIEEHV